MQIVRGRCSELLGELAEGKTILYKWVEVKHDISEEESAEDEAAQGASTDQPLLAELAYKEVDGVWAARAKLRFAHTLDQMFLTPEEELQFYGFSEENAHKKLLEAEFVEDEDDAYMLALTHVEAIKENRSLLSKTSSNQSKDSSDIQDAIKVGSTSIFQPDIWRPTLTAENHISIDEDVNEEEFPLLKLAVTDRRDTPEQFITLYKGGLSTMKRFLQWESTTDARHVTVIESDSPSDFCTSPAIYLTSQKEVAEYYARLRRRISGLGNGDVGILTIYIRQFEHETLQGDTWKKFVYLNRLDKPLPKAWNQWNMAPILKGEVAGTNASETNLAGGEEAKCSGYTVTTAIPLSQ
ncbi:hypothetical protein L211DRAFT_869420 [Terfezia boudieri ATCC MYA-4762]|uniref:Uncharacterized protein n=1 Tax=Terfezia boudieri ATCC MYA-4762 TaxID=1051890 RepID=A0A3N4LW06_9PEZI|nr:hypothetical protein L211DRAFT_869420 [Terfezia boudieri ATCC MYA-4762]